LGRLGRLGVLGVLGGLWGGFLGVLGTLAIELAMNLMNLAIDLMTYDKIDEVSVLRRSVIKMRGGGVDGRAAVGVVVAIAPQLQWVDVNYS